MFGPLLLLLAALTPAQRTLRARTRRIQPARTRQNHHRSGPAQTAPSRSTTGLTQVDPDGTLPDAERAKRAEHARKAYMTKLALAWPTCPVPPRQRAPRPRTPPHEARQAAGKRRGRPRRQGRPDRHDPAPTTEPEVRFDYTGAYGQLFLTRRHSSPFCRWRHFNMNRRRRAHLEFKDLLARLEPQTCNALHSSPADFGLTPDELRREANRLVRDYGWTIPEVCAVLDVESPVTGRKRRPVVTITIGRWTTEILGPARVTVGAVRSAVGDSWSIDARSQDPARPSRPHSRRNRCARAGGRERPGPRRGATTRAVGRVSRRDEWRAEVIKSSRISDSVRVVLIVLADTMTDAGYVSIPRSAIARAINRSPRRVTERLELAREAGYLAIVRPARPEAHSGVRGHVAERVRGCARPHLSQGLRPGRTSERISEVRIAATIQRRTSAPLEVDSEV